MNNDNENYEDKAITFDELLEACVTQNELAKYSSHYKDMNAGEITAEMETLYKLHTYAMCRRRIAKLQQLKNDIHNNITAMIDACDEALND